MEMIRKIIRIDEEKCDGCGLCVEACHEGALGLADGKARLLREDYCDGFGDCLPECPMGAISFEEREAPAYDAAAVAASMAAARGPSGAAAPTVGHGHGGFEHFPIQIKLVSPQAPRFSGCHLAIAADCAAFVHADFKRRLGEGKALVIGCPKLDGVDYSDKLSEIIAANEILSVTVIRMEVPCCGGLVRMSEAAIEKSGKTVPLRVETVGVDGDVR
jgi:NAD-dependent dihydropyrimidine dehydrogenase PreA subunit